MGSQNNKFEKEDFGGFRHAIKNAKMKNHMKKRKHLEKKAKKLGLSIERYIEIYGDEV